MSKPLSLVIFIAIVILTSCFAKTVPQPEPPVSPLLGTATRPLVPTYTPTATFTPTPVPTATPLPLPTAEMTRRFISLIPKCTQQGTYNQCYDPILDISFEYPNEWGIISATLTSPIFIDDNSSHKGQSYDYHFSQDIHSAGLRLRVAGLAGGRSRDFSEPRDGWVTDFPGFGKRNTQEFCNSFAEPSICEIIKSGVVVQFYLPQAQYLCDAPFMSLPPEGFVYINLPEKRLINGFVFVYPLLSQEEENSLYSILGVKNGGISAKCHETQTQELFDQAIKDLHDQISSRTGSDDLMRNVNILIRLANSIQGQEANR